MPPVVRFEPKRPNASAADAATANGANSSKPPSRPPTAPPAPLADHDQLAETIASASERQRIGDALIAYTVGRFEAAAVFILRDSNALGWRVNSGHTAATTLFETASLPLGGASSLQAAHDSRQPYRGQPPSAGRPVERKLWELLGTPPPGELIVVPVIVRARVVNLVYAHAREAISDDHAEGLLDLCQRASDAYIRLIQRSKAGASQRQ